MRRSAAFLALIALVIGTPCAAQQRNADTLFARGELAAAESLYRAQLRSTPTRSAALRVAQLSLWHNRLDEAAQRFGALLAHDHEDRDAMAGLAETRYRQLDFGRAAALERTLGHTARADMLAALHHPYRIRLQGATTLHSIGGLLPVVPVQVNGHSAWFLIDTGGGETIIDPAWADSIGTHRFGIDSAGGYAGGATAKLQRGAVDSLRIGDAVVRDVPVQIQDTRRYSAVANGHRVDGVIGTVLLSHFRSTIDFASSTLTLEPRGRITPATRGETDVPFWWLGDHFVTLSALAAGQIPTLLIYDTGLAMPGGALVAAAWLIDSAHVALPGSTVRGVGGGGSVYATPFEFPSLAIDSIHREHLAAIAGVFPPVLEWRFGARIGGLVSHGFFEGMRVTMDFDAMSLRMAPSSGAVGQ